MIGLDQNLSFKKKYIPWQLAVRNVTYLSVFQIFMWEFDLHAFHWNCNSCLFFLTCKFQLCSPASSWKLKWKKKKPQQCLNKVIISHQIDILGNVTHMFCLCYAPVTSRLRHTIPDLWGKTIKHDLLAYILLICSTDVTFHFSLRSAS